MSKLDTYDDVTASLEEDAVDPGHKPGAKTKWGNAVTGGENGYSIVPDSLLRRQTDLKLDPTDVVLLLNISLHWWEGEPKKLPHPRPAVIARRMGISTRTIERRIARLCELGLLEWLPSKSRKGMPSIREFNLRKLIAEMEKLANPRFPKVITNNEAEGASV